MPHRHQRFAQFVRRTALVAPLLLLAGSLGYFLADARPAGALPVFARKYGTSCLTCHTVFPKLNPFGEAFRRNGFRFPGKDSDFVKQDTVTLGQESSKKEFPKVVWPGTLPTMPFALAIAGAAVWHPDTKSSGGLADNGTPLSLQNLVEEAPFFFGGSMDDQTSYFGEVVLSGDGVELETAEVIFSDMIGPQNAVHLAVGKPMPALSSFGKHSSYVDRPAPAIPGTELFGGTSESWSIHENYPALELNGTLGGRVEYAVGANSGANEGVRPTHSFYGHLGVKLGGMRLDGVGGTASDPGKPWAETALTLDGFAYGSKSEFVNAVDLLQRDHAVAMGGGVRGQWGSLELNFGVYQQKHTAALWVLDEDTMEYKAASLKAQAEFGEASYVLFPWLVPAVRVEFIKLEPEGADAVWNARILPGLAMLIRPNIRLSVVATIERALGAPDAGWGPAGGQAVPFGQAEPADVGASVHSEVEGVEIGLMYAF